MQSADLSLIKEIPGYQIIMKAVLKHQIQQLVEQLSETTGEESILLTASVSDGSLSHLGSESGRSFLDGHNEIKSQFLGYVLKSHHTKKTEKQFASGPGRKTATVPLSYEDSIDGGSYNEASYTELQQDTIPPPAITPTKPGAKRKKPAKKAPTPVEIKVRPKRSAAAMKSPLKSDIYVGENDDIEEISESEQEQADSVEIEMVTGEKDDAAEYTEIVPVSDPIPVLPKVDTEDLLLAQGGDSHSIMENIIVKKEAELDYEAGTMEDEEDPDWEPGTKKRRKSSGSRSLASPVNVTATRSLASPVNVGGEQAQNDKSTFMCSYCGKMYSSAVNLRRHQQIHEEPQHCHCGATFTTKEALKEHENAKHKSLYFCKKCPNLRRFSSRSGLFAHNVKAHKADTSLKCEICDRRFGQLGHLKDHMNAHSDEAKYECNSCGSKFKFHTSLRNHEKICTGEVVKRGRPKSKTSVSSTIPATTEKVVITCEKCGKTFCDQRYLKQHEQKHLGNIKLCPNCGKSFKFQSSLSRHIKACSKKGLEDSSVSSMDVLELSATKYEGSEHMKTSSENVVDDSDELYIKTVLVISSADTDNHTVASVDQMSSPDHVTASANALMPSVDHVTFSAGHMLSSASHVMPGVNHVTTTVSEAVDSSDYSRVPSATITNVLPRTTAVESGNVMVLSGNTNVINDENAIVE